MAEYTIKDYQIFQNAIGTTKVLNEKLEDTQTSIKECKEKLSSDSIFMGPIAESCKEGSDKCTSRVTQAQENYSIIARYIQQASDRYKSGDKDAENYILGIDDGKIKVEKASSVSYNGKTIFYNQKGYYKDGKLHQWPSKWGKSIASSGCGPTSMAACLANMFGDPSITPTTIANLMKYDDNIGGRFVTTAASKYGIQQTSQYGLSPERMNKCLRNGGTMIVAVNNGGHYIAILGIDDSTKPPTYIVNDPNNAKTSKMKWSYQAISAGHTMVFYMAPKGKSISQVT